MIYLRFFQSYQFCIHGSHMTFRLPSALRELLRAIISLLVCRRPLENAIYYFLFLTLSLIHALLLDCRALFYFFHYLRANRSTESGAREAVNTFTKPKMQ